MAYSASTSGALLHEVGQLGKGRHGPTGGPDGSRRRDRRTPAHGRSSGQGPAGDAWTEKWPSVNLPGELGAAGPEQGGFRRWLDRTAPDCRTPEGAGQPRSGRRNVGVGAVDAAAEVGRHDPSLETRRWSAWIRAANRCAPR